MMVGAGSEALEARGASMRRLLFVSGSALAVLAVAMTVTGVLLAPSGPTLADEAVRIARVPATRVSFVIASLLPVFVTPFTVALALWAPSTIPATGPGPAPGRTGAVRRDPLRVSAVILTILYAPLSVFACTSQYLLVPRLAEIDAEQAAVWYLGNESAFTLGLDVFAYLLWGSAAILIAWRLLGGIRSAAGDRGRPCFERGRLGPRIPLACLRFRRRGAALGLQRRSVGDSGDRGGHTRYATPVGAKIVARRLSHPPGT